MLALLRTATIRLALLYLGLFLSSVGVILWVVYGLTAGFVERELSDSIAGDATTLRGLHERHGLDGLVLAVRERSANPHHNSIYLLQDAGGTVLAGNLARWPDALPDADGRLHFRAAETGGPSGQPATAQAFVLSLPDGLRLLVGSDMSEVIDGGRRFDVVLKLSDADRTPETLARMRMDTPAGHVPLSSVATIVSGTGPNQIMREAGMRRIVLTANTDGSDMAAIVKRMRGIIQATPLPTGYATSLEGGFRQEEEGRTVMAGLCAVSVALVFLVLYQRDLHR